LLCTRYRINNIYESLFRERWCQPFSGVWVSLSTIPRSKCIPRYATSCIGSQELTNRRRVLCLLADSEGSTQVLKLRLARQLEDGDSCSSSWNAHLTCGRDVQWERQYRSSPSIAHTRPLGDQARDQASAVPRPTPSRDFCVCPPQTFSAYVCTLFRWSYIRGLELKNEFSRVCSQLGERLPPWKAG